MVIWALAERSVLQGLMSAAWQGSALVSQLLVAGESVCRSQSWLLVVLSQYVGRGRCPFGSLFRLAVHPTLVVIPFIGCGRSALEKSIDETELLQRVVWQSEACRDR